MKRILLFYVMIISSALLFNCSKDDDSSIDNTSNQKLIGKWYFDDRKIVGLSTNNSFTFSKDKTVIYSYWSGGSANDFEKENGTYELKSDVLTMTFPKGVSLTYVQKVTFINDKKIEFTSTSNSNEQAFTGTYYKE
ncbi:lipocalin family protein [Empedobacter falsenii]